MRTWGLRVSVVLTALLTVALFMASDGRAMDEKEPTALQVTSLLPQGEAPRLTQIVVGFNKQMMPLGTAEQAAAGAPLRLEPRPAGAYRWLDPSTLAYIFDKPIIGATRIKISVPAGIKALDGSTLAQTVRASAFTPSVQVSNTSPRPGKMVGPRQQFRLYLNQPVKIDSLNKNLAVYVGGKRVGAKAALQPPPKWQRNRQNLAAIYIVTLDKPLPPQTGIRIDIGKGLVPENGDLLSDRSFGFTYRSYNTLRLVRTSMPEALLGGLDPSSTLMLEFNNPVKGADVWKHIKIDPPLARPEEDFYESSSRWVHLDLKFQPGQTYKVMLEAGLKDDYGTALAAPVSHVLKMGDLNPLMALGSSSGVLELPGVLPLRLRNLDAVDLGLQFIEPDKVVPALVAEAERDWDDPREPPKKGEPGVVFKELQPDLTKNRSVLYPLDLGKMLDRSPTGGLILVDARASWPDDNSKLRLRVRRALVQVTKMALSLKLGASSGAVWVTGLADAKPLAGVTLELRDRKNNVLWQGVSDENGLAKLPGVQDLKPAPDKDRPWRNPVVYLLAQKDGDMAVLPGEWGWDLTYELPSDVNFIGPVGTPPVAAHALVQLPLYQPGQEVRFAVYLRRRTADGLKAPEPTDVILQVNDPYGKQLKKVTTRSNRYGTVSGSVQLSSGTRLGNYTIRVKFDGKMVNAGNFRVASFRPPDFKVTLDSPADAVGSGPAGKATVDAQYLFGAPVVGGKAELTVNQEPADFAPRRLADFAVGDIPLPGDEPNQRASLGQQKASLDVKGLALFDLPKADTLPGMPVRLQMQSVVADKAGMFMNANRSMLVHPAAVYVGLKTPLIATAKEPAEIEMMAAGYDDKPAALQNVKVTAYRQYWETVREKGPGGYYRYLGQARRKQVWQGEVNLPEDGATVEFIPPQAGTYVLVAETKDADGRKIRSAAYMWASGGGVAGWQRFDGHQLEMEAASDNLKPGQTARILVKNPFAKATALVSVERRGVRSLRVVDVDTPAPIIEVPIGQKDYPGVYVGVLLVRGRVADPTSTGVDLGKPQVRLGYCRLNVARPGGGLAVLVTTDRDKARPGEMIKTETTVSKGGSPYQAQVTLLAVDERVLTAAGGVNSYDPMATFGRLVGLGVLNADMRTQVIGKILAAQKGEDGAGGGGASPALRQRFHPAVFWLADAETDADGKLSAEFHLPDTPTAYRVVAVAADQSDDFATAKTIVRVSKPLQVLSALPRFATSGDAFDARFIVQNFGQKNAEVTLSAQLDGLEPDGPTTRGVSLAPGESKVVGFAVKAVKSGEAAVSVRAVAGAEGDAARYTLDVRPRTQLTAMAAAGELKPKGNKAEIVTQLETPADSEPDRGGLSLELADSLAPSMARPAKMLLEYPWNCWEQRLSRASARALRISAGKNFGLQPDPNDLAKIKATLGLAIDFQTGSGGFVYWRGMQRADALLTAYTLIAAKQIAKAGPELDSQIATDAIRFLENALKAKRPKKRGLYYSTAEALSIWALAAHGRSVKPYLETALGDATKMSPFGLAALIQAAHLSGQPGVVAKLIQRLEVTASVSATGLHFATINPGGLKMVMGSRLRGNALALWALSQAQPAYPRMGNLARWIATDLAQRRYISTQDAVYGLWGMQAYLNSVGAGKPVNGSVSLDGRELAQRLFKGIDSPPLRVEVDRSMLDSGKPQNLRIKGEGQGVLFWTARLLYAPLKAQSQPVNAGLRVARFLAKPGENATGTWQLGDEVEYVVTISADDTRFHVVVVAPYPAGLEPIRSRQGAANKAPWQWSELRTSELLLYTPVLRPGVYTYRFRLRAVSPGSFMMPPLKAEEMYAPEVFGATVEETVEVR